MKKVSSIARIIISFLVFHLGTGETSDGAVDDQCKARVTGTTDANTDATKV